MGFNHDKILNVDIIFIETFIKTSIYIKIYILEINEMS